MKNFLLVPLFMVLSHFMYSQNYLFDAGQSGFHLGGQITSFDGGSVFGITPGYTSNGKLTTTLGIGFTDYDSFGSGTSLRPGISYLVMKQDNGSNPVSIGLNASYQYDTYSDLEGFNTGILSLGGFLAYEIAASEKVNIIPLGGVSWNRLTVSYDGVDSDSATQVGYGLGAAIQFNKFYIQPVLDFADGDSQFSLLFGMIFPK